MKDVKNAQMFGDFNLRLLSRPESSERNLIIIPPHPQ